MTRRPLVAANWKMHKLGWQAREDCSHYRQALGAPAAEVVIFPSFPLLAVVAESLHGTTAAWGGQDLHPEDQGAHTGDVSGRQLADVGCSWVLCGHSERRADHGESDDLVARKVTAARRCGLRPMLCIGETARERRDGRTFAVLERQLRSGLEGLRDAAPGDLAVAYEPVWAIGTGETATPELAQEVHARLRALLGELLPQGKGVRILYGGSVKPANAAELFAQEDIDGFLVGGASLDPESFLGIISVCDD